MIGPGNNNVGERSDYVAVPFTGDDTVLAYLKTGYYHIHGASFLYPDKAAPVTLISDISAWGLAGNKIEVIPAGAMARAFDLHWASLSDISATLDGVIDIYAGPVGQEVLIGSVDVVRTSNFSREAPAPVQIPQQPAGTRISCRFADSTASSRTVRIKFYGHVYGMEL